MSLQVKSLHTAPLTSPCLLPSCLLLKHQLYCCIKMVYNLIVASIARKNFELVNKKDYDAILAGCVPNIRHRFGGDHALGGERHDIEALRRWFHRLGRLAPNLTLKVNFTPSSPVNRDTDVKRQVQDIWVKGWPWDTILIIRWTATDITADGGDYRNHGVHIVRMKWFKVVDIDANEDSAAVERNLKLWAKHGVEEAAAPPILS